MAVRSRQFNEVKIYYANLSANKKLRDSPHTITEMRTAKQKTYEKRKIRNKMEKKPAVYLPAPFLSFSSSAIKRGSMNRRR